MMRLPNSIITKEDLETVAMIMKSNHIQVPIMGYEIRNNQHCSRKVGIARANDTGDNIEIETRNIKIAMICPETIYPQIIAGLRQSLKTA